jgi:hypothetical protein
MWCAHAHDETLTSQGERATFVSYLERGVVRSLLRSTEKSSERFVVARRGVAYVSGEINRDET